MQLGTALLVCLVTKRLNLVPVADLTSGVLPNALPLSVLFITNVAAGFVGLRLSDIPLFLCVRRTTTIFTMALEYFVLGKVPMLETVCVPRRPPAGGARPHAAARAASRSRSSPPARCSRAGSRC